MGRTQTLSISDERYEFMLVSITISVQAMPRSRKFRTLRYKK